MVQIRIHIAMGGILCDVEKMKISCNLILYLQTCFLVTTVAQFTIKMTNSERAIYFLSLYPFMTETVIIDIMLSVH